MTTYFVIYEDNSTDYIPAYSWYPDHGRAVFDQGNRVPPVICLHVKSVEVANT